MRTGAVSVKQWRDIELTLEKDFIAYIAYKQYWEPLSRTGILQSHKRIHAGKKIVEIIHATCLGEPQKNTLYIQERNYLHYTCNQIGQNFCQGWEKRRNLLHSISGTTGLVGQDSDQA